MSLWNILSIFAPNIILNKDICPILEDYFEELDIHNSNENLIEFNLKIQIYILFLLKFLLII